MHRAGLAGKPLAERVEDLADQVVAGLRQHGEHAADHQHAAVVDQAQANDFRYR